MEVEIKEQSKLLEYMPRIQSYKNDFDSLNNLLGKTTLTGKISSLSIAENLFEYMEETKEKFTNLQTSLIKILTQEYFHKAISDIELISKLAANLLMRFLRERKADVQTLANDTQIRAFLTHSSTDATKAAAVQSHLADFLQKYKTYSNIFLLSTDGKIILSGAEGKSGTTIDPLISQTLNEGYCENYRESDLLEAKQSRLLLSMTIKASSGADEAVGVLCMVVNLEEEFGLVFDKINSREESNLVLIDSSSYVIATSNAKAFNPGSRLALASREGYQYVASRGRESLVFTSETQDYMGYTGARFTVCGVKPFHQAFMDKNITMETPEDILESSSLISHDLKSVIEDAENINEDLSDVVINGEIIASKKRSYELNPVLDNVRLISNKISDICFESIKTLQKAVIHSYLEEVGYATLFAVEQVDRLLAERSNNARWLVKNETIRHAISQDNLSGSDITGIEENLAAFMNQYPYYTNAFVFDDAGTIVAVSHASQQHFKGKAIDKSALSRVMGNHDSKKYVVSDFEVTPYYHNKPTYIFYATVLSDRGTHNPVGGVALVLDAEKHLNEILTPMLMSGNTDGEVDSDSFAVFVDKHKLVVASTTPEKAKVGETLEIDPSFINDKSDKGVSGFFMYDGHHYLIASHKARGYRDFRKKDAFSHETYAILFKRIRTEMDEDEITLNAVATKPDDNHRSERRI